MIVLIGDSTDRLVSAVAQHLRADAVALCTIDEAQLCTGTAIALTQHGTNFNGWLRFGDQLIGCNDVQGVLVRLPRLWWPSPEFDLQDQMFVYHETMATWFWLLSAVPCPVINRFSLGWWLHDATYPELLRQQLAAELGLAITPTSPAEAFAGRLFPTPPPALPDMISVYLVGTQIIERDHPAPFVSTLFDRHVNALQRWQRTHEIGLFRVDVVCADQPRVHYVETYPVLDDEPPALIDQLSTALVEQLV